MVTLNIEGSPRVVLLNPFPDDPKHGVPAFVKAFKDALQDKRILVGIEETRSWGELCNTFKMIPEKYEYNCLLIVTHGTAGHRVTFQDPAFPIPEDLDKVEFLGNLVAWSSWFRNAFDDKMLMIAACHSGTELNSNPLLHSGMALHVLAPNPANPKLEVSKGAEAMALFLDLLAEKNITQLTPEHFSDSESQVNIKHPDTLKLWPYEADPEFVAHMSEELTKWWEEEGNQL